MFIEASLDAIQTHLDRRRHPRRDRRLYLPLELPLDAHRARIAIPTSIIATFGLMAAMGYTLNQITMLALTLMVGIVIDDAIVVLENIYRFIEEKGMAPFQAAIEGTQEIGLAVMATTLSLLAVFLPVGFMGGIVGRFMSSFGLTAAFAIAVSLLVSFTLTPMLAARLIKRKEDTAAGGSAAKSVADDDRARKREATSRVASGATATRTICGDADDEQRVDDDARKRRRKLERVAFLSPDRSHLHVDARTGRWRIAG